MKGRFGLVNRTRSHTCFLNVAVQTLWHLNGFRKHFLSACTGHKQTCHRKRQPCFLCAFSDFWSVACALQEDDDIELLDTWQLRETLSLVYKNVKRFQLGQMDDAAECLDAILVQLHKGIVSLSCDEPCSSFHDLRHTSESQFETENREMLHLTAVDICSPPCLIHELFGMSVVRLSRCPQGHSEEPTPSMQGVIYVLGDELLRRYERLRHGVPFRFEVALRETADHQRDTCGCGDELTTYTFLLTQPRYMFISTVWTEIPDDECFEQYLRIIPSTISATECFDPPEDDDAAALNDFQCSFVSSDAEGKSSSASSASCFMSPSSEQSLSLVSVICYFNYHYVCFCQRLSGKHSDTEAWYLFDDSYVTLVGSFDAVLASMGRNSYLPVLFSYSVMSSQAPPTRCPPTPPPLAFVPKLTCQTQSAPCLIQQKQFHTLPSSSTDSNVTNERYLRRSQTTKDYCAQTHPISTITIPKSFSATHTTTLSSDSACSPIVSGGVTVGLDNQSMHPCQHGNSLNRGVTSSRFKLQRTESSHHVQPYQIQTQRRRHTSTETLQRCQSRDFPNARGQYTTSKFPSHDHYHHQQQQQQQQQNFTYQYLRKNAVETANDVTNSVVYIGRENNDHLRRNQYRNPDTPT